MPVTRRIVLLPRRTVLLRRRGRADPPVGGVSLTDILWTPRASVAAALAVRVVLRRDPQELPVMPYF
jgi:hypothetical protein